MTVRPILEPSVEQLANFACLRIYGPDGLVHRPFVADLLRACPSIREGWLDKHRAFQQRLAEMSRDRAASVAPPADERIARERG